MIERHRIALVTLGGLLAAGCMTIMSYGSSAQSNVQPSSLQMYERDRIPTSHIMDITTTNIASTAHTVTNDAKDIHPLRDGSPRPTLRTDIPDCGLPNRPTYIYPHYGGDAVITGMEGVVYLYDSGDVESGPDFTTHDMLRLPGLPSDPEIVVGAHTVAFCYPKRRTAIIIYRQTCAGNGWNNTFESITFEGGVSFLAPNISEPPNLATEYMTEDRAHRLGIDWLNDKRRSNWYTYAMPVEFLPSQDSLKYCRDDNARSTD